MDGGDDTLMKVELVRRCSQPVITVTHIHRRRRRRRLLTTTMSKRRLPRGAICSRSPRLIWDVKLRHLNKSLLQFFAPAECPTRSSKMSTGKKTSWPNVKLFKPASQRDASWGIGFFLLASASFSFLPLSCWFYSQLEMSPRKTFSATILSGLHIHLKWLSEHCGRDGRLRIFPY